MKLNDKIQKRAKRKYSGFPVISHLSALDSPFKEKYQSSLACSSSITIVNGKTQSRYCKRPWCNICGSIRTAVRLNKYAYKLGKVEDLQFTTLTLPNVPDNELKKSINHFRQVFKQFRNTVNLRYKRMGFKGENMSMAMFKGVYNFEVTINPKTRLYHPHIHILHTPLNFEEVQVYDARTKKIVDKRVNELMNYWLEKTPTAVINAQDSRQCTEHIEAFKYQAKAVHQFKKNGQNQYIIFSRELDLMYQALESVRCFQTFGLGEIELEEETPETLEEFRKLAAIEVINKPDGVYLWQKNDWELQHEIDFITGEVTTDENNILWLADYTTTKYEEKVAQKVTKNEFYLQVEKPKDLTIKPQKDESEFKYKKIIRRKTGKFKTLGNVPFCAPIFNPQTLVFTVSALSG